MDIFAAAAGCEARAPTSDANALDHLHLHLHHSVMSLAKLTSVSTQTLSLLLERQRGPFVSSNSPSNDITGENSLHLPQIRRNMEQLRNGILDMEAKEGKTEATRLLRSQYDRMRSMLPGVEGIDPCVHSIRFLVTIFPERSLAWIHLSPMRTR